MSEQPSPEPVPVPEEPLEIQSVESNVEPAADPAPASRAKWIAPAWFFLGILVGVIFGTKLAIKLNSTTFKKIYALFLLGVAVYMVVKYI